MCVSMGATSRHQRHTVTGRPFGSGSEDEVRDAGGEAGGFVREEVVSFACVLA